MSLVFLYYLYCIIIVLDNRIVLYCIIIIILHKPIVSLLYIVSHNTMSLSFISL